MTQKQLAEAVGVCSSTVVGWEKGEYRPRAQTLPLLCAELGVEQCELTQERGLRVGTDLRLQVDIPELREALGQAGEGIQRALSVLKKLDAGDSRAGARRTPTRKRTKRKR